MDTLVEYDVKLYIPHVNEWINCGTFRTLDEAAIRRYRIKTRLREETTFSFQVSIIKRSEQQIEGE